MFITFEGIDGSGKSTQARLLYDRLEGNGQRVVLFREPGGTELSERVRALLLDPDLDIQPLAELLLFSAARAQLVSQAIRPALSEGAVVICDRFFDSTTAYQGLGRQVADTGWLLDFNRTVTDGLTPDRTYYLAIDPSVAYARRHARRSPDSADDRMEQADRAFYERVTQAYDALAAAEPDRIQRLDGRLPIADLRAAIEADFQEILAHR
jgi:dTMP kinase